MEDLDLPPDALASAETTFASTGGTYIPPTTGNINATSVSLHLPLPPPSLSLSLLLAFTFLESTRELLFFLFSHLIREGTVLFCLNRYSLGTEMGREELSCWRVRRCRSI